METTAFNVTDGQIGRTRVAPGEETCMVEDTRLLACLVEAVPGRSDV